MKQGSRERINLDNLCCPKWEWHVTLLQVLCEIPRVDKSKSVELLYSRMAKAEIYLTDRSTSCCQFGHAVSSSICAPTLA